MTSKVPVWSTAGAVPVRNEKGDLTMEKVKVARYVSGKKPEYAAEFSDGEDETVEFGFIKKKSANLPSAKSDLEKDDRRLRRLRERMEITGGDGDEDRSSRRRRLHEPEVLGAGSDGEGDDEGDDDESMDDEEAGDVAVRKRDMVMEESSEEEEEDLDEEEIDRRRALLRQKAKQQREEEEVMELEEEKEEGSGEESSEWEEYSDSEEEETGPRLKPVFVRKKDRITIQEKEKEVHHQKELLQEAKRIAEERRRQTLKMVEKEIRKEISEAEKAAGTVTTAAGLQDPNGPLTAGVTGVVAEDDGCATVITDDENDEQQYEAWKVRELRRVKRDRDERDTKEKEQVEVEKLRNMTEEERRLELKMKPKVITNKGTKGKYKFLQKYYHRGAFFLDNEDNVYTRDFSCPTLEDHFDKTILPKVMQVKNFGRSGRTKYTHLVDQDTTSFDSPWSSDMAMNLKFHINNGGGMKQSFEKPTTKKRK